MIRTIAHIKSSKVFSNEYEASLMERLKLSRICLLIISAIRSAPQEWEPGSHKFTNEKAGLQLWIANGRNHLTVQGHNITPHTLNSTELDAIWQAYIWWVEEAKKITEISLSQAVGGIDVEIFK